MRLEFKDGKVIVQRQERSFLIKKLIRSWRALGEFAIGTNERIDRFTDRSCSRKIGGVSPGGRARLPGIIIEMTPPFTDMVCDLHKGGEITVDGKLFYQNGKFVVDF
jgi:aminopeptidase